MSKRVSNSRANRRNSRPARSVKTGARHSAKLRRAKLIAEARARAEKVAEAMRPE